MLPQKLIDKGIYWSQGINLVDGCSKVSAACKNCWAEAQAKRFTRTPIFGDCDWYGNIKIHPERLKRFEAKKPQVFSIWNDLFHEKVPDEFVGEVILKMYSHAQHQYLILTKRISRAANFLSGEGLSRYTGSDCLPPDGLWFGTTVEDQNNINRLTCLENINIAPKKFCSFEPLLGPLNFEDLRPDINYAVVGCETGPNPRLCDIGDMANLVGELKQCNIPVFVKAVPINGKPCKNMSKWPKELQYRELPFTVVEFFNGTKHLISWR